MKAFPIIDGNANYKQEGMDLRDHFAGLAMQSLINKELSESLPSNRRKIISERSYKIADEMMEARNDR